MYARLLLTNVLPSLGAKLAFMARSNVNGNIVLGFVYIINCLCLAIALAAANSSAAFGFVGCALALLAPVTAVFLIVPHYFAAALRIRLEVCSLFEDEGRDSEGDLESATVPPIGSTFSGGDDGAALADSGNFE